MTTQRTPSREHVERTASAWIAALRDAESMPSTTRDALWRRIERSVASTAEGEADGDLEIDDLDPLDEVGADIDDAETPRHDRRVRVGVVTLTLAAAAALAFAVLSGRGRLTAPGASGGVVEAPYGQRASTGAQELVRRRGPAGAATEAAGVVATEAQPARDPLIEPVEDHVSSDMTTYSPRQRRAPPRTRREGEGAEPTPARGGARTDTDARPPPADNDTSADSASAVSSLSEETDALRRVHAALASDEPARALELLAACARRFPDGQLLEERAALRVIALCELGKLAQGRAEAEWFLDKHPRSALAGRVRAACDKR